MKKTILATALLAFSSTSFGAAQMFFDFSVVGSSQAGTDDYISASNPFNVPAGYYDLDGNTVTNVFSELSFVYGHNGSGVTYQYLCDNNVAPVGYPCGSPDLNHNITAGDDNVYGIINAMTGSYIDGNPASDEGLNTSSFLSFIINYTLGQPNPYTVDLYYDDIGMSNTQSYINGNGFLVNSAGQLVDSSALTDGVKVASMILDNGVLGQDTLLSGYFSEVYYEGFMFIDTDGDGVISEGDKDATLMIAEGEQIDVLANVVREQSTGDVTFNVPEPSSLLLMLGGLIGFLGFRNKV